MAQMAELERVDRVPESLWARIRANPERAAELIALEAAESFNEPARRWAATMSPHHEPAEVAKIAMKKHARLAALGGAATGFGGMVTLVPNLLGLIWIQSRMVFYIAASYGYDPAHPMRPAELLVLFEVYPTAEEARAALDGVGTSLPAQMLDAQLSKAGEGELRKRLMRYAYRQFGKRAAGKLVPFISSPISAVQNSRATTELGRSARRYYGG